MAVMPALAGSGACRCGRLARWPTNADVLDTCRALAFGALLAVHSAESRRPIRKASMTLLSVNVNKIAVLRNSRGGTEPDIVRAALTCIEAGCGGITVRPRRVQHRGQPLRASARCVSRPHRTGSRSTPHAGHAGAGR